MKDVNSYSTDTGLYPKRPRWPQITWTSSKDLCSLQNSGPRVLGINPWIYDFAAFNFWSRPSGLLSCLEMLRRCGAQTALLDCLDPMWRDTSWPAPKKYGCGAYPKTALPKPDALRGVPRNFSRYGLPFDSVAKALPKIDPAPDCILITTIMTYWYPGALTAARLVRGIWPKVPIVLGGIYASLCYQHAACLDAFDLIIQGPLEERNNWQRLWNLLGLSAPQLPLEAGFSQALDLYAQSDFAPVLGSRGCPFDCAYCASSVLYPDFRQRQAQAVWQEVENEINRGIRDFAFYDDALLVKPEKWLLPVLKCFKEKDMGLRLHTPNALHVRYLKPDICVLLKNAGLTTVRLGLESADFTDRLDRKLTLEQWSQGLENLFAAGFKPEQIGAYILFGLPEQSEDQIQEAINLAHTFGIRAHLALYTPIPGSKLFGLACRHSDYALDKEPLFHNNSLWPCYPGGFSWKEHQKWKERTNKFSC